VLATGHIDYASTVTQSVCIVPVNKRQCLMVLPLWVWFCLQGVEFFDEKLNALFMAWLLDHGISRSLLLSVITILVL